MLPPFSPNNPNLFPIALTVMGDPDYESEELMAYELGYRFMPANALSIDLAIFYNDYDNLRSPEVETPVFQGKYMEQPMRFGNELKGKTYGLELAAVWQAADWWRWDMAYSYLRIDIDTRSEKDNTQNSDGPQHQASLRSAVNLSKDMDFDFWLRYVDNVKAVVVKSQSRLEIDNYFTIDIRLAWRPNDKVEIAMVGQNLLDDKYQEYIQENFTLPTEVERGIYGKVTWRF